MSLSYMLMEVTIYVLVNTTNALNKTINEVITKQIKLIQIQNSKKVFTQVLHIYKFLATVTNF